MSKRLKAYECEYCNWKFNIGYNRFGKESKINCPSCLKEIDYNKAGGLAMLKELSS